MKPLSPHDWETLSAYLDGELSSQEKARLEARLWKDASLRNALDELGRTRLALRNLPRLRAPRNFTLSRKMVAVKPAPRLYPFFGFASALATVFLLVVLLMDFLGFGEPARPPVALMQLTQTAIQVAAERNITPAEESLPAPTEAIAASQLAAPPPEATPASPEMPMAKRAASEETALPTETPVVAEEGLALKMVAPETETPADSGEATPTDPALREGISSVEVATDTIQVEEATPAPTETPVFTETQWPTETVTLTETASPTPSPIPTATDTPTPEIIASETATEAPLLATAVAALPPTPLPTQSALTSAEVRPTTLQWAEGGLAAFALLSGLLGLALYLWRRRS